MLPDGHVEWPALSFSPRMYSPRKKPPRPTLIALVFDCELRAKVPGAKVLAKVRKQIALDQFAISPQIDVGGNTYYFKALYPDALPKGGFEVALSDFVLSVKVSGRVELDVEDLAEVVVFMQCVAVHAPLLATVADADCEPMALVGHGEGPFVVGHVEPTSAAGGAPSAPKPAPKRGM
jgi:hypothetical protein